MATAKKATAKAPAAKKSTAKKPTAKKSAPTVESEATRKAASTKKAAPLKKAAPVKKAVATKKAPAAAAPVKKAVGTKKAPAAEAPAKAAAAKKAPVAKRPAKRSPFDAKFLEGQRESLLEERATLEEQASVLKAEADSLTFDREPGDVQFDDESGEGDTLAVERDFDLARAAQARSTIDEIDAALRRIEKGTYGMCEYSGEPIPRERLKAIPWAREKVEYKTRSFR